MKCTIVVSLLLTGAVVSSTARADDDPVSEMGRGLPRNPTFSTLVVTPLPIEGLTGDADGNLYVGGNNGTDCPIWRISINNPTLEQVGTIPGTCNPLGIAFDSGGNLFVANGATGTIWRLAPATPPATATLFASGVPGANGIAFDRRGNLWTGDGATGQGRVWKIAADGTVTEVFRVQPMANEVNLVGGVGGVGRDVRSLPPGTITVTPTSRAAANTAGSQAIVANGIAFDRDGRTMFVADTARGAIWRVGFDRAGNLTSPVGCDTTFAPDTLCLDNVLVAHPILEGADGIALDRAGNIWVAGNERNTIAVVAPDGRVTELFRNVPDATTLLRNTGPLEFPTSPVLTAQPGSRLCVTNSDGDRRDNSPRAAGEINAGGSGPNRGKITCLDQPLRVGGLPLPIW
jgi:sugar lactone lactonase YvrE